MIRRDTPELPGIDMPQRRARKAEAPGFHQRVIELRKDGHRVYRAGLSTSSVDGQRVTNNAIAGGIWAKPAIGGNGSRRQR